MSGREKDREIAFINDWNEIMDFKVDEGSLRTPTNYFIYHALESLLRSLNYDIECIKSEFNEHDDILYYIKFCKYIDSLYQLSGANNRFYYYDLIHPVSKKCFHVLKTLLNYLIYYEMVKKEVITKATEVLGAHDDALEEHTELLKRNKETEKLAEEIKYKLNEYETAVPQLAANVNQLTLETNELDKVIKEKTDEIEEFKKNMMKIDLKYAEMVEYVVTEESYYKHVDTKSALKMELNELKATVENTRSTNLETKKHVEIQTKLINEINKELESHQVSNYKELMNFETELENIKKEIANSEQKKTETTSNLNMHVEAYKKKSAEMNEKKVLLKKIQHDFDLEKTNLKNSISMAHETVATARNELLQIQSEMDDLEAQQQFLMAKIVEILRRATDTFIKIGNK